MYEYEPPEARALAVTTMRGLIEDGALPHDLPEHYWFEKSTAVGKRQLVIPPFTRYVPINSVAVEGNALPPSFRGKAYEPPEGEARARTRAGMSTTVDGLRCLLLPAWRDPGIDRQARVKSAVEPLGFVRDLRESSYEKQLSPVEHIRLDFDFDLWAGMWRPRFSYFYKAGDYGASLFFPLMYWGVATSEEDLERGKIEQAEVSTASIFAMTLANVVHIAKKLEAACVPVWRAIPIPQAPDYRSQMPQIQTEVTRAKEWLRRAQAGDLDRSARTKSLNETLSVELLETLQRLGAPQEFVYAAERWHPDAQPHYYHRVRFPGKSVYLATQFVIEERDARGEGGVVRLNDVSMGSIEDTERYLRATIQRNER